MTGKSLIFIFFDAKNYIVTNNITRAVIFYPLIKPYYFWIMNVVNHMMSWFFMWRMSSGKSYSFVPCQRLDTKKRWSLQRLSNVDQLNISSLLKGCPCRKALVPVPLAWPFRERSRKLQGFELMLLLWNMNSSHASTFRPRLV